MILLDTGSPRHCGEDRAGTLQVLHSLLGRFTFSTSCSFFFFFILHILFLFVINPPFLIKSVLFPTARCITTEQSTWFSLQNFFPYSQSEEEASCSLEVESCSAGLSFIVFGVNSKTMLSSSPLCPQLRKSGLTLSTLQYSSRLFIVF